MERLLSLVALCVLCSCAAQAASIPANVHFGQEPPPPPMVSARASAAPRILAMWFSTNDVARGTTWSGRFSTTTNVASVEVRTNLFSIDVPHRGPGRFAFNLHVLDVPPIFLRAYRLRVIARNTAGMAVEEDLPMRIH